MEDKKRSLRDVLLDIIDETEKHPWPRPEKLLDLVAEGDKINEENIWHEEVTKA
jgi:hypothetical protein